MKTLVHAILFNILVFSAATAKYIEINLHKDPEAQALEIEKNLDFFMKAARLGDQNARYNIATYYYVVPNNNRNKEKALQMLRELAEEGHAVSQFSLGQWHLSGDNMDLKEGVKWMHKAADQGIKEAQLYVGLLTYRGLWGVKKDVNQAITWLEKAANKGLVNAQLNLAILHENEKNYEKAFKWYLKAAEEGKVEAQTKVGNFYYEAKGVTKNTAEAIKWYLKAADKGFVEAQVNLAILYEGEDNFEEAANWCLKAAENGHLDSQVRMGKFYYEGIGVFKNINHAIKWSEKAAKQKHTDAQYNLALIYLERGDRIKSLEYLRQAAAQGNNQAELLRSKIQPL